MARRWPSGPIRPEDEPPWCKFHETLSERSVYLRYFHLMNLAQRVRARTADAHLFHRLRPRDGAGGGAAQSGDRRDAKSWASAA